MNTAFRTENEKSACTMNINPAANTSIFNKDQLLKLTSAMTWRKLETGTYLFWEGDLANTVYFIRSGKLKLRQAAEDGKELLLSILQQGDLIAELDPLTETLHRYSAQVMEATEVGTLGKPELELLLVQDGELALRFAMWVGMMQRRSESKLRDLILSGKQGALASTLIRLGNSFGRMTGQGLELHIKLTNTELAELTGTTRESVNRMLSAMKESGIIDNQGGSLRILRLEPLRKMAGCPDCPACPKEVCRI